MNQLYPIIRRARRSLWPDEDPQKETKVTEAEASAVVASVEPPLLQTQEEPSPIAREAVTASEASEAAIDQSLLTSAPTEKEAVAVVVEAESFALATEVAPVEPKPKRVRRRGNAPE